MSGGDVLRTLNRAGLAARLIDGAVLISPADKLTPELRALVLENRPALVASLEGFGLLNRLDPSARGIPYDRWLRSLPQSAFDGRWPEE